MSESQILKTIKSVAWQLFPDCRVILFGSRARQDVKNDSDYDILLIIDKTLTPSEKIPLRTQLKKSLLKYQILSDILIQSEKEVRVKSKLTGHIVKTIMREGIAI